MLIQPINSGMMNIIIFICGLLESVVVIFCWRKVVNADSTGNIGI